MLAFLCAQIVNVQPLIATDPDKQGVSVTLEGSLELRKGNVNLTSLSGSGIAMYRGGRHTVFIMAREDYVRGRDEVYFDLDMEHVRYRFQLLGPAEAEIYAQHDRDVFRRMAWRGIAGTGPRLHFLLPFGLEFAVSSGVLVEYNRVRNGPYPDADEESVVARSANYVLLTSRVLKNVTLGNAIYVQPRFGRLHDTRMLNETSLLLSANKTLSIKLSLTSAYDQEPAISVLPLDISWKSSLALSL
jgi:hypothetical protein